MYECGDHSRGEGQKYQYTKNIHSHLESIHGQWQSADQIVCNYLWLGSNSNLQQNWWCVLCLVLIYIEFLQNTNDYVNQRNFALKFGSEVSKRIIHPFGSLSDWQHSIAAWSNSITYNRATFSWIWSSCLQTASKTASKSQVLTHIWHEILYASCIILIILVWNFYCIVEPINFFIFLFYIIFKDFFVLPIAVKYLSYTQADTRINCPYEWTYF